jgi:plasmid stabilization system protein ParE
MKVRYTRRALGDLQTVCTYVEQRAPAVAQSIKDVIEQRIAILADIPLMALENSSVGHPRTDNRSLPVQSPLRSGW